MSIARDSPARLDSSSPIVHIVEDDDDVRSATARLLTAAGHAVETYASAAEFLRRMPISEPGCVILDLRLPDASGLELQDMLAKATDILPVLFVTGHGDIPTGVRAVKAGAVDFLTKPVPSDILLSAVATALARDSESRSARVQMREVQARYERLTPRERQVFAHLISGQLNKQVAFDLGTTERTIKAHRHSVMQKLEAESMADLVRIGTDLQISPVRGES